MKVLFAVNNENISESIIKKYQQEYKEIISVKNVYYFNAIIKELQRDKTYDRIVISEDLQPVANNNYDSIDKFIFEKLDNISDEANTETGDDIPILLICTDRREKSDPLLVKLFGIGVYNAIIGKDRSITTVCQLLHRPRTKKEAKVYYNIDADDVEYKVENEGDVEEAEIQNILNHYKKIGKNEEKIVEDFDHIASQYTDSQLRLIATFLPLNVKAVLEARSAKYQEVVSFATNSKSSPRKFNDYEKQAKSQKNSKTKYIPNQIEDTQLDIVKRNLSKNKIVEPVVIPSAVNTEKIKKIQEEPNVLEKKPQIIKQKTKEIEEDFMDDKTEDLFEEIIPDLEIEEPVIEEPEIIDELVIEEPEVIDELVIEEPQIDNNVIVEEPNNKNEDAKKVVNEEVDVQPKKRGRPKKIKTEEENANPVEKKKRGRPKKVVVQEPENIQMEGLPEINTSPVNLFELSEDDTAVNSNNNSEELVLPGIDDESFFEEEMQTQSDNTTSQTENEYYDFEPELEENNEQEAEDVFLPTVEDDEQEETEQDVFNENTFEPELESTPSRQSVFKNEPETAIENTYRPSTSNYAETITGENKIVAFLGTSKNGTSFLVNNIAELLSQKGINTAILDLTKNKNAFYIYTENEEKLRNVAYSCIENLKRGEAKGIPVHKNLTVYTTLPGEGPESNDCIEILNTLSKNYSVVILDCDFETEYEYFKHIQELYLVQTMDVLTIQPLTAFLRNLKARNALNPEIIRIVLNKVISLRSVNEKIIIGGMAYYNDPAMSFMTELFNKDTVPYCTIPFEEQTYAKYLDGLINCKITLNGYSKNFISALNKLADMVYPLIDNNPTGKPNKKNKFSNYNPNLAQNQNTFSSSMNDTLSRMKNKF